MSVLVGIFSSLRYPRRILAQLLIISGACVSLILFLSGHSAVSPVVAAPDDDPTPVGFIDQASGRFFTIQLNAQEHDYGRVTVGIPGVGYLVSAGVAQVTVNSPTAVHLQYTGNGWLDAAAQLDPLYICRLL